ncbi:MAG TPA: metallophosphoesterase [Longimicrobiales bacterium]
MPAVRVLFLADSHLGFDLPVRPRIERRRRGHDFLANYALALEPALRGEVDLVIHGGDVFDMPAVDSALAYQAFEPLRRIAERGIPVFIVPGNHERSRLPHLRFAAQPNIHIFDRARTFVVNVAGQRVALAGFPYERRNVRGRFAELLEATGWQRQPADVRLLCVHHCVEGATVGPQNYTFRSNHDVIRIRDIPAAFSALLSGHIHRHQVLTTDLRRRPVDVPVLYPGSIERTAFAEMGEEKGYLVLQIDAGRTHWQFRRLPARPMMAETISLSGLSPAGFEERVRALIAAAPLDAVVAIRCEGDCSSAHARVVAAARLRSYAPASMNVEVWLSEKRAEGVRPRLSIS